MPIINRIFNPEKYSEIKEMRKEYLKNKYLFVSLAYATESVAKKIKDYFLGITYAKKGMAFQFQKIMLYVLNAKHDPNDITQLSSFLWKNGLWDRICKINIKEKIDFGTIGIKIGDKITFKYTGEVFLVASGNGTPGNGGTMVKYKNINGIGLYSLRLMTRIIMGGIIPEEIDIFSLWTYKGKTLRSLHEENKLRGKLKRKRRVKY